MDASVNAFTASLFCTIVQDIKNGGNIFLSPLSISTAMSMLLVGSNNNSKTELIEGLKLTNLTGNGDDELHKQVGNFLKTVRTDGDGGPKKEQILLSNILFIAEKLMSADSRFSQKLKTIYDCEVEGVDFGKDGPSIMAKANSWVDTNTKGMIKSILDDPPNVMTRLILMNAIYFKGKWRNPFDKNSSFDGDFFSLIEGPKKVKFMAKYDQTLDYTTASIGPNDGIPVHVVDLPYSTDCSMRLVVPMTKEGEAGQLLTKAITDGTLVQENQLNQLLTVKTNRKTDINVVLPVFKFAKEYTINDYLKSLGISDIFGEAADFSGITGGQNNGLYVSEVRHKAVVDVNEEGTEAAAVTSVQMRVLSFTPVTNVKADLPFLFFIRKGQATIFAGLYARVPE